ncbi:hypothetical protein Sango_1247900 [Sesamum angolense]|uniref:Uncharacterized protein n=1 Tax=Sesamum angolense TaxID=2727404 RepID=A0AAE1WR25_9LAMI|nr:hypothetical protein Sango_1247900 [Sesamum angolense]
MPGRKVDASYPPRKGVIQMIAGRPNGGDSHRARKLQVREVHDVTVKEVLDVEAIEDTPLIEFGQVERSGPKNAHNNALVITTLLANYEVRCICLGSGSSTDILFGDTYDQMQLGDTPLEKVRTSLYGFAGEVVHPRSMISLPLTLWIESTRRTCLLKFLVIKFPTIGGLGEVQVTPSSQVNAMWRLCVKGKREIKKKYVRRHPPTNGEEKDEWVEETKGIEGAHPKVQSAEELLNIELLLGDPEKTTRIGSQMENIC